MDGFSLYHELPIFGRSIVVHTNSGSPARSGCGVIGITSTSYAAVVEEFVTYPHSPTALQVRGMLSMTSSATGPPQLRIWGILSGLQPGSTGGWHIHSGFGCTQSSDSYTLQEYPAGHFYPGLDDVGDPWIPVKYYTDANGVAIVDYTIDDFTVAPGHLRTVTGRSVVVHDTDGNRVACGLITPYAVGEADAVAISQYPGSGYDTWGLVFEKPTGPTSITFKGIFTGLQASSTTNEWHVHTGFSCETEYATGAHYYEGVDDWYGNSITTSSSGVGLFTKTMTGYSYKHSIMPVAGRAVVAHLPPPAETMVGCGPQASGERVLPSPPPSPPSPPLPPASPPPLVSHFSKAYRQGVVIFDYYPGNPNEFMGSLVVQTVKDSTLLFGVLGGLTPGATGKIQLRGGYSCETADAVGLVYSSDWDSTTYTADENGVARISMRMDGYSLYDDQPIMGKPIAIHADSSLPASTPELGCGLIQPSTAEIVSLEQYPGYEGSLSPFGLLLVDEDDEGISIQGTIAGLESNVNGGWHVHSGYSCDKHEGVKGHYYDSDNLPPSLDPWNDVYYTSDANGVADIDLHMGNFTLATWDRFPIFGRTIVTHDGGKTRHGCGVIGGAFGVTNAMVAADTYPGFTTPAAYSNAKVAAVLSEASGHLVLEAHLSGLEASVTGGIHIHSGFECSSDGAITGGHYIGDMGYDRWTAAYGATYTTNDMGIAHVVMDLPEFSLESRNPVRAARWSSTSSAEGGQRVACGIITPNFGEVAKMDAYPETTYPSRACSSSNRRRTATLTALSLDWSLTPSVAGMCIAARAAASLPTASTARRPTSHTTTSATRRTRGSRSSTRPTRMELRGSPRTCRTSPCTLTSPSLADRSSSTPPVDRARAAASSAPPQCGMRPWLRVSSSTQDRIPI